MDETLFFCHRCRQKVIRSEMRYSKDGSQHLCVSCYSNAPHAGEEPKRWVATDEDISLMENPPDDEDHVDADDAELMGQAASKRITAVHGKSVGEKPGRVKYLCVECRYSYALNRDSRIVKKCPNCGCGNALEVTEVSMDELLE